MYCFFPRRRGSFLLLTMIIFFIIVLVSANFYQYMMQQKRFAHRMGQEGMMTKVAYAIATLAIHKIQFAPLCNDNDLKTAFPTDPVLRNLYSWLSKPIAPPGTMGDLDPIVIDLEDPASVNLEPILSQVLEPLKEPISENINFQFHIEMFGRERDFEAQGLCKNGYSREKHGLIHILVRTSLRKGDLPPIEEEFRFVNRVKVMAALAPVLSKFSLYVGDTGLPGVVQMGGSVVDYNVVKVQDNGVLENSAPQPIILDNDGEADLKVLTSFKDFVDAKRGLVYLGGGVPLVLNLARSPVSSPLPECTGEEFQFFCNRADPSRPDPSYTIGENQSPDGKNHVIAFEIPKGVSSANSPTNQGYYNPLEKNSIWGKKFVESYRMKFSSLFRLLGVEPRPSPTLVLGNVRSGFLQMRFFKILAMGASSGPSPRPTLLEHLDYDDPSRPFNPDNPEKTSPTFKTKINSDYFPLAQAFSINDTEQYDWPNYLRYFSSRVTTSNDETTRNWNSGLRYLYKRDAIDSMAEFDPKFQPYLTIKAPPESLLHTIPESFQPIMTPGVGGAGTPDLKDMKPFMTLLKNPERILFSLSPEGNPADWKTPLRRRGLFSKGNLALSGWVFLKQPFQLEFSEDLAFVSNGGIILEKGDIIIHNAIKPSEVSPQRQNVILQIVALDGNIIVDAPTGKEIWANLIACGDGFTSGRIILNSRPRIHGAMAMQRMVSSPQELLECRGADLDYYPPLAALPKTPDPDKSEEPLLSYGFESSPIQVK